MRILHAPYSVAGNAYYLSRAERKLGHTSDTMVFGRDSFDFPADIDLDLSKLPIWKLRLRTLSFFARACLSYDIFHFNFGGSLFSSLNRLANRDLPVLKFFGRKIVFTFQGCDVRDRFFCLKNFATSACQICEHSQCDEEFNMKKRRMIETVSKYAGKLFVLNPDLLKMVPGSQFLPYASVDPRVWIPSPAKKDITPLKILHAPTSRSIKGTARVIGAVENLKKKGAPIELLLVENVPHQQTMALYREADIAIDQLSVGWYGAFAVEAMALAIPTLCYIREEDLHPLPFKDKIPLVRTSKETLEDDLMALVESSAKRKDIGERSRAYVEEVHDPRKIAQMLIETYQSL